MTSDDNKAQPTLEDRMQKSLAAWHDRYHSSPRQLLLSARSAHTNAGHIFPTASPPDYDEEESVIAKNSTFIFRRKIMKLIPKIQF